MPDDLTLLADAAREAGAIALKFWKNQPKSWDKPEGAGPVTEADLAVDGMLKSILQAERPDYGWLSEETDDDAARLSAHRCFILDPIDGTRNFLDGGPHWSISIAVVEQGLPIAAAVYLPARDQLFLASEGGGATCDGEPLECARTSDIDGAQILATKAHCAPDLWPQGVPPFKRTFRSSLAYRLALVGQGRHDGMINLRPTWEWDVAAGTLIAQEAGALVSDQHGQRPTFNTPSARIDGFVSAAPDLHQTIIDALTP